jgi:hypothetical protein
VKYSPDGDTLWARRYLTQSSDDYEPTGIVVDSAGNAYVTGTDWTITQIATVKYDASGIRYWANQRPGWANGIALANSGALYVTGGYNSPTGAQDFLTVAYDTASGETAWAATYDGPAHDNDGATAIAVGASGRVYVAGCSTRDTVNWNQDFLTIAYQPTGETLGVRRVPGPYPGGADYAEAIALDSAENMYVCGYGVDSAGSTTLMAVSYGDGGVQRGLVRYVGSAGSGGEWTTVNTFGSSTVYLAGYSYDSGTWSDWTVAKYGPFLGIAGMGRPSIRTVASGATIVHRMLSLPGVERPARSVLLDVSGRAVAQLAPGTNDMSRFAPGVYFVHQTTSTGTSTRKVVFE